MNPNDEYRLISICDDDSLRYSREMILRHAGYEVVSVTSNAHAEELTDPVFDMAIVCQSVNPDRAIRLVETLRRRNPGLRVFSIRPFPSLSGASLDSEYEILRRPDALLRAIASMRPEIRRSA